MGERSSVNVAPSLSPHGRRAPAARRTPFPPSPERRALDRARRRLLELQRPDGCWCGELQGDTILESEYVLLMAFLGRENDDKARKAAEYVRRQQRADGGWGCYPGGPVELSVSVKAYFALKLTGHDPDAPYMRQSARGDSRGGRRRPLQQLHQVLPRASRTISLRQLSVGAAGAGAAAALVLRQPLRHVELDAHHRRAAQHLLGVQAGAPPAAGTRRPRAVPQAARDAAAGRRRRRAACCSWGNFFLGVDAVYKAAERLGLLGPFRRIAVEKAAAWMRERFRDSDGLGAIFPPMIYTVVALRCLGVADDAPEMRWALEAARRPDDRGGRRASGCSRASRRSGTRPWR